MIHPVGQMHLRNERGKQNKTRIIELSLCFYPRRLSSINIAILRQQAHVVIIHQITQYLFDFTVSHFSSVLFFCVCVFVLLHILNINYYFAKKDGKRRLRAMLISKWAHTQYVWLSCVMWTADCVYNSFRTTPKWYSSCFC